MPTFIEIDKLDTLHSENLEKEFIGGIKEKLRIIERKCNEPNPNETDIDNDIIKLEKELLEKFEQFKGDPIIYEALIALSVLKPRNDFKTKKNSDKIAERVYIDPISLADIENTLYTSHRYVFDIDSLVKFIKSKKLYINPVTKKKFCDQDIKAIEKLAKIHHLDLSTQNLSAPAFSPDEEDTLPVTSSTYRRGFNFGLSHHLLKFGFYGNRNSDSEQDEIENSDYESDNSISSFGFNGNTSDE